MAGQRLLPQSLVSPEDQRVTYVELFFDLVFVFSVTQTVGLLHDGLNWPAIGQVILVFWLIWWAWTQYAWALNAADTTHPLIVFTVLAATAVAFFMAVAVPAAFGERALWFSVTYVLVRLIGLLIYYWVASANQGQKKAVRSFMVLSFAGMVAVLGGAIVGGFWQYGLWAAAILLDIVAALYGGRNESWYLHADHFGERHGLFVIIALGESLIVAAGQVAAADWTGPLISLAVVAVAATGALWWSYFPLTKPALDHALAAASGSQQSTMARDAYSLLHFVMVCGIIAYAVAIQEAAAHPEGALSFAGRASLAAGVLLFIGGMGLALWRSSRLLLLPRAMLALMAAALLLLIGNAPAVASLALVVFAVTLIVLIEQRDPRLRASSPDPLRHSELR